MKLLHLSDLHLGKRLKEQSFIEDQQYILDEIIKIASDEKPEGVIIAGDIYDKSVPSAEAVGLFDRFLTQISEMGIKIYAVSGNHDSAERIAFGANLMKAGGVHFSPVYNGNIEKITETDQYGNLNIYLLPFIKPSEVREFFPDREISDYTQAVEAALSHIEINPTERNIIVSHQFVTGASKSGSEEASVGGLDNVDSRVFEQFDYTALGHIHGSQNINGGKIRYCGTPLKYSFSEANHKKTVTVVDFFEKGSCEIREIPLVPLRDMRDIKGKFDFILENTEKTNDYIRVILTDDNEVLNAAGRLRHLIPNLLELSFDSKSAPDFKAFEASENTIRTSPEEVFLEFYRSQKGKDVTDEEKVLIEEIIRLAKEDMN